MKLLSSDLSPYATRVRTLIRLKQLDIAIEPPDVPLRTPAFVRKYPYGKIPVLVREDGECLAESWSIMQYLESVHNTPSFQPEDPWLQAQMNARGRFADTQLAPAAFPLFSVLLGRQQVDVPAQLALLRQELAKANVIWRQAGPLAERGLDLADIALVPVLYFVLALPRMLGHDSDLLAEQAALQDWWSQMMQFEAVKAGIDEMEQAFQAFANR
ncbi:glutathione S-transferase family protein [Alkalimonas sp.]|uniref:glutathione S-transferase family protein n=1 Tax=Alkalimonas sp. TaxID=1872453 RepID=UPI00263AE274|nr:glutathione S-transferase family protein [Alkalimonas sp.]MCC5825024.1 glutathione S-transferase family protein [Alkalimonas sp.]